MPEFDVATEQITVFRVDDDYLFKHFFERADIFEELSDYYDQTEYRFTIPADEFDEVCEFLEGEYYEPVVVEELEPYCVVKEKYTKHADILRNSVANWERDGQLFFLMKDELSVREAVEKGARRIGETEFVVGL